MQKLVCIANIDIDNYEAWKVNASVRRLIGTYKYNSFWIDLVRLEEFGLNKMLIFPVRSKERAKYTAYPKTNKEGSEDCQELVKYCELQDAPLLEIAKGVYKGKASYTLLVDNNFDMYIVDEEQYKEYAEKYKIDKISDETFSMDKYFENSKKDFKHKYELFESIKSLKSKCELLGLSQTDTQKRAVERVKQYADKYGLSEIAGFEGFSISKDLTITDGNYSDMFLSGERKKEWNIITVLGTKVEVFSDNYSANLQDISFDNISYTTFIPKTLKYLRGTFGSCYYYEDLTNTYGAFNYDIVNTFTDITLDGNSLLQIVEELNQVGYPISKEPVVIKSLQPQETLWSMGFLNYVRNKDLHSLTLLNGFSFSFAIYTGYNIETVKVELKALQFIMAASWFGSNVSINIGKAILFVDKLFIRDDIVLNITDLTVGSKNEWSIYSKGKASLLTVKKLRIFNVSGYSVVEAFRGYYTAQKLFKDKTAFKVLCILKQLRIDMIYLDTLILPENCKSKELEDWLLQSNPDMEIKYEGLSYEDILCE